MESLVVWARVRVPMSRRMSSGLSVEGLEAEAMPPLEMRLRLCDINVRSDSVDDSRDFAVILDCGGRDCGNARVIVVVVANGGGWWGK